MAGLWIPRGFQKPLSGARVNMGHPLSAGLVSFLALNDAPRTFFDLVRRVSWSSASSTGVTYGVGAGGPRVECVPSSGLSYLSTSLEPPTANVTVLVLFEKRDATNRESSLFGVPDSASSGTAGQQRCGAHVPWSDGVVYWDFGFYSGANRLTASGLSFQGVTAMAFAGGADGSRIWHNGRLVASSATSISRVVGNSTFYVNNGNNTNLSTEDHINLYAFAMYDRMLTTDAVQAWAAEPYGMLTR